jgi:hypothetical protein
MEKLTSPLYVYMMHFMQRIYTGYELKRVMCPLKLTGVFYWNNQSQHGLPLGMFSVVG